MLDNPMVKALLAGLPEKHQAAITLIVNFLADPKTRKWLVDALRNHKQKADVPNGMGEHVEVALGFMEEETGLG